MASNTKRYYVSDYESSSSDSEYVPYKKFKKMHAKENKDKERRYAMGNTDIIKSKCTTRNAVMARQNRIKKKMYVQKLETEISKLKQTKMQLNSIITNQSYVITDLRKELKYVKSLLTNSPDISNLMKNIRDNTGMSVKTCLDKTLNNDCVSKHNAKTFNHPWGNRLNEVSLNCNSDEENLLSIPCTSSDANRQSSLEDISLDLDMPSLSFNFDSIGEIITLGDSIVQDEDSNNYRLNNSLSEHNYYTAITSELENSEDVGVCLHVSKHKVSLEFCSSCSENAIQTWKENN